ncbi:MAG TPA: metallophosphoesterase [Gemmatimonadaceae bacterium]
MTQRSFHIPSRVFVRLGVYYTLCWGIVALLAYGVSPIGAVATILVGAYTTIPLFVFLRGGGWTFYPTAAYRLYVIRPVLYAQTMLPLVAGSGVLGLIIGAAVGHPFGVARWFALVVATVLILMFVVGYAGSRRLVIHELEASLPNLPPEFDGATIAQISDLHVGPHTSRFYLRRVVAAIDSLSPDVIAVTGDQIDDRPEDVAHYAAAFAGLRAPLGVFIIVGNHDVYAGWDDVERELRVRVPATLLLNESHPLRRDGAVVYLAGTGDPAGIQTHSRRVAPDIELTLSGIPRGTPVIALAHNPALWPMLAERGVALTLSGHTHWGQFSFPQLGWSLASPFLEQAMGAYQRGDALLYITPGAGYWGLPFRVGASAEVTHVTLRRGPAAMRDLGRHAIGAGAKIDSGNISSDSDSRVNARVP